MYERDGGKVDGGREGSNYRSTSRLVMFLRLRIARMLILLLELLLLLGLGGLFADGLGHGC